MPKNTILEKLSRSGSDYKNALFKFLLETFYLTNELFWNLVSCLIDYQIIPNDIESHIYLREEFFGFKCFIKRKKKSDMHHHKFVRYMKIKLGNFSNKTAPMFQTFWEQKWKINTDKINLNLKCEIFSFKLSYKPLNVSLLVLLLEIVSGKQSKWNFLALNNRMCGAWQKKR